MDGQVAQEPLKAPTSDYPQLEQPTVAAAFRVTARAVPDTVALRTKGDEVSITWSEYFDRAARFAAGLKALGLSSGDTMALMLTNRPDFHIADAGAMLLGLTPFSIYNTYTPEQIEYLVGDAANRVIVTEKAFLPVVEQVLKACDAVEHLVVCDEPGEGHLSFDDLMEKGDESFDADAAIDAIDPDDVITLIYTSGTTGPPKGVQITHGNLMATGSGLTEMMDLPKVGDTRIVSYLPMAHIAERAVGHYLPMLVGATVTSCPDPRKVMEYLPEVRPSWFFAVPRIWEKLKAGIEAKAEAEPDEDKRTQGKAALDLALKKVRMEQAGEEVPAEIQEGYRQADEHGFSKLRQALGLDQLIAANVGAAPTPPEVLEFFHAIGIPVAELWGMSETCGAGTVNRPDRIKIGTVGQPSPGVEVKLAEDGEVLVRGPVVMKGYRNNPEKTAETIDSEGWVHTGDIGEMDDEGYLKIVDRKKELIINAAGKNMSPANIEAKLKSAGPLIGQAVAIGDSRPYNVALLTLDPDSIPGFAKANGIEDTDPASLAENETVVDAVSKEVEGANAHLARVEQIKKFKILPTDWEPGGDELTPTMKLKRKPIAEKYAKEIEALYE
jgi:long-chain acyl-CoA synthetase